MSEWQPIATAPKDQRIIAWSPLWDAPELCFYVETAGRWETTFDDLAGEQPTHWMRWPEPPKE